MKNMVILKAQDKLLEEKERLIIKTFGEYDVLKVPENGLDFSEMKKIASKLQNANVIFCSPVPDLLRLLSKKANVYVYYN